MVAAHLIQNGRFRLRIFEGRRRSDFVGCDYPCGGAVVLVRNAFVAR